MLFKVSVEALRFAFLEHWRTEVGNVASDLISHVPWAYLSSGEKTMGWASGADPAPDLAPCAPPPIARGLKSRALPYPPVNSDKSNNGAGIRII